MDKWSLSDSALVERRHMTIFACDLVGSTALAHKLDAEDFKDLVLSYRKCVTDWLASMNGYFVQYAGDAVWAYFGYPEAHEDDVYRAIQTGLTVTNDVAAIKFGQQTLDARVGIATGLCVVGDMNNLAEQATGSVESKNNVQITAFGNPPNLAARLQTLAEPGSVIVSDETRVLASARFEFEDLQFHNLKGFEEPIRAWKAISLNSEPSRFKTLHSSSLSPLVGREAELRKFQQAWNDSNEGKGQVMHISGYPGIGKSRTIQACCEKIQSSSPLLFEFHCSPNHTSSALYPLLQQIRHASKFQYESAIQNYLLHLDSLLDEYNPTTKSVIPFLAKLMSIPIANKYIHYIDDTEKLKYTAFKAAIDIIKKLSNDTPILMVVEDAHWLDPSSSELLNLIIDNTHHCSMCLLVSSRPGYEAPWFSNDNVSHINLDGLTDSQCEEVIYQLTKLEKIPEAYIKEIFSKTNGNPLYMEEVTKTLMSSGVLSTSLADEDTDLEKIEFTIPSTLHGSLMARLDQLKSCRECFQIASVIGNEFTSELLTKLIDKPEEQIRTDMELLVQSQILVKRKFDNKEIYRFKHALIKDAAYENIIKKNRRQLHAHVARVYQREAPENSDSQPELLAYHFTQAGMLLEAIACWEEASKIAFVSSLYIELITCLNEGISLLDAIADKQKRHMKELQFQIMLGAAYRATKGFASQEVENAFTRAYELCKQYDEHEKIIDVLRGLFACYYVRAQHSMAMEQAEEVLHYARNNNDETALMLGSWMRGCTSFWQGKFNQASKELDYACGLYKPGKSEKVVLSNQIDPGVNALIHLGWTLWIQGYPEQAIQTSDKAIAISRDMQQPFAIAMAIWWACSTRICCGEFEHAEKLSAELELITTEHNISYLNYTGKILQGSILIEKGEIITGTNTITQTWNSLQQQKAFLGRPWFLAIIIAVYYRNGRYREGFDAVNEALTNAEEQGEKHWLVEILRLKAELILVCDTKYHLLAIDELKKAIYIAQEQGSKSLELRAAISLARIAKQHNVCKESFETLQHIYDWFTEGYQTRDLQQAKKLIAELT